MAGKSSYAEIKVLGHALGKTAWTMPAIWVALYTAAPTDAGGGTEVTGGSYARKSTAAADWTTPTGNPASASNANAITFVTATATWGTVTHFGLFDALTVGNLIYWGPLGASRTVASGDTVSFAVGTLVLSED
jgi:hypothetical protein